MYVCDFEISHIGIFMIKHVIPKINGNQSLGDIVAKCAKFRFENDGDRFFDKLGQIPKKIKH